MRPRSISRSLLFSPSSISSSPFQAVPPPPPPPVTLRHSPTLSSPVYAPTCRPPMAPTSSSLGSPPLISPSPRSSVTSQARSTPRQRGHPSSPPFATSLYFFPLRPLWYLSFLLSIFSLSFVPFAGPLRTKLPPLLTAPSRNPKPNRTLNLSPMPNWTRTDNDQVTSPISSSKFSVFFPIF